MRIFQKIVLNIYYESPGFEEHDKKKYKKIVEKYFDIILASTFLMGMNRWKILRFFFLTENI